MPFGIDDAMMLAPAGINILQQLLGQGKQNDQFQLAMQQIAEQRRLAKQQYELSTASRTTARGDRTSYIPGQGWIETPSADTASRITGDNALAQKEFVRQMVAGEPQRDRDARRQVEESGAAEPLLREFEGGYGMPTREGVVGKHKVAAATASSDASDRLGNAAAGAALRTGASSVPLGASLASLNRGAASGLRSSLAGAEDEGDQMFQSAYKQAAGNKLDPYNMLATRATGTNPVKPDNIGASTDASLSNAAQMGAYAGNRGASEGLARGYAGAAGAQIPQTPSYDLFALGVANLLKGKNKGNVDPTSVYTGDRSGGFY